MSLFSIGYSARFIALCLLSATSLAVEQPEDTAISSQISPSKRDKVNVEYSSAYVEQNFSVWPNKHFDRFVVNNNVDFSRYNKVIFFPMQFDQLTLTAKTDAALVKNWNDSSWEEMDKICGFFDYFAEKKFKNKERFTLTRRGGADVLAIEFRLTEFTPRVSKDGSWDSDTVGDDYIKTLGSMKYRAVIADSQTAELIAVIEDGIEIEPRTTAINNKTTQNRAWRTAFKRVLNTLHAAMVDLHRDQLAEVGG